MFTEDLSSYVWLHLAEAVMAKVLADFLCKRFALFGSMQWLVSGQGPNLKNQLINGMAKEMRSEHFVTTAYSLWENITL